MVHNKPKYRSIPLNMGRGGGGGNNVRWLAISKFFQKKGGCAYLGSMQLNGGIW